MAEGARVEVLLATFNGERFLREQVESILAQEYEDVCITARDDGSSDGTVGILEEYAAKFPERFRVLPTEMPTGSAKGNFLRLMEAATAEYVCFADQDDVWLPDKVRRSVVAMNELQERSGRVKPLMVFSDLRVVDDGLQTVAASMWAQGEIDPRRALRLERLVGASVVTGCTMLVNRAMVALAVRMPVEATMHDRWISLISAAMGGCAFLRGPTVLYRQHGGNVVGAAGFDDSVAGKVMRARDEERRRALRLQSEVEVEAFLLVYGGEMPAGSAELLRAYLLSGRSASAWERVVTTLRRGFFRPGLLRTLVLLVDLARGPSVLS